MNNVVVGTILAEEHCKSQASAGRQEKLLVERATF